MYQAGYDPRVLIQAHSGIVLFCLGFPDQALARTNAAIAEARKLAHLPYLALSLTGGARLLSLVGDNGALDRISWVGWLPSRVFRSGVRRERSIAAGSRSMILNPAVDLETVTGFA